jgi:hypothetical protein
MKPETRRVLSWVFAIVPVLFLSTSYGAIKFMIVVCEALIKDKQITALPAPTRLLLTNAGLASALPLVLALVFVASVWLIRRKPNDEASSLTLELAAHTAVWFLAINYFCGVSMAAFLPWAIAINR